MVKVDGTDDIVDLIPAPGAIYEDGTFRNKANDLTDATAALFGFGSNAVQNDLFEYLGQYAQHWWSIVHGRERTAYVEQLNPSWTNNDFLNITSSGRGSVQVAKSVDIDQTTGEVSLHSPTTYTVTSQHDDAGKAAMASAIRGSYILGAAFSPDYIYFIPVELSINYSTANVAIYNYYQPVYTVKSTQTIIPAGATTYVRSSDRNVYTEGEDANGNVYSYLGIPYENAVTVPKVATGSYMGTGTVGSNNPNILTFDFVPKYVRIVCVRIPQNLGYVASAMPSDNSNYYTNEFLMGSISIDANTIYGPSQRMLIKKSADGKTLTWSSSQTAAEQYNVSGYTYYWIAIG